jgi:DNA-binding IscR family transcriptional regulator
MVADVVRAVSGPLATVRGLRPQAVEYNPSSESLKEVWIALRANIRTILEHVTLADLAAHKLPARVRKIIADPDTWQ